MVYADTLTPNEILAAIARGDFYASSGVSLRKVSVSSSSIDVDIAPEGNAVFTTQFIGTLADPALAGKPSLGSSINARRVGVVLAKVVGQHASYTFKGNELYVRAVVTSSKP